MNTFERGGTLNMSMREKSLQRRKANREHNSNFRAGYIHIREDHLLKTGIRGRKRYILCLVLLLLTIIVIFNFLVNIGLFIVLRIKLGGHLGPKSLEFIPNGALLRFLQSTNIGKLVLGNEGRINSGYKQNLTAQGQQIKLNIKETGQEVKLGESELTIQSMGGLRLKDAGSSNETYALFTEHTAHVDFPTVRNRSLKADQIETRKVMGMPKEGLQIYSDHDLTLVDAMGTKVRGQHVNIDVSEDIKLQSEAMKISTKGGVILEQVERMPLSEGSTDTSGSRRVCVCMPGGHVYTVPAAEYCDQIIPEDNPCKI